MSFESDDLRTIGDLARELNYSYGKAQGVVKDMEPALSAGNGRLLFYSKSAVVQVLFERHKDMLTFMGYLSPEQSYDMVTQPDADASDI